MENSVFYWAKKNKSIFIPISSNQYKILQEIAKKHPEFLSFLYPTGRTHRYADPFLISLAREEIKKPTLTEKEVNVITEESQKENRLKIPFVCNKLGINSTNLHGMFKLEKWKLVIT